MKTFPIVIVLTVATLLAACGGGPKYRPPSEEDMRPRGPIDDGVPAAHCLLAPWAGADGILTAAELDSGIRTAFATADASHDGWLDKGETQRFNEARAGGCDRSPLIDWRGSGRIGINDFTSRYRTAFSRADVDGDGMLNAEELSAQPHFREPPRKSTLEEQLQHPQ